MPIIVNDFDMVLEPQPAPQSGQEPVSPSPSSAPAVRPEDMVRVQIHHCERLNRVWAD